MSDTGKEGVYGAVSPGDAPTPTLPVKEAAVLVHNNVHAPELSWLDRERLKTLIDQTFYARRIGDVDAFLLVVDERAEYDSPNHAWVRALLALRVRGPRHRGRRRARARPARRLYADLARYVAVRGHDIMACEVDVDPPNSASGAFHAVVGSAEISSAVIHGDRTTLRCLAHPISPEGRRMA